MSQTATSEKEVTLEILNMDCADCAAKVQAAVARMGGVQEADLSFATARMKVRLDPEKVNTEDVIGQVRKLGYDARVDVRDESGLETRSYAVEGMDCADCAAKLENVVGQLPGVESASINFATAKLTVVGKRGVLSRDAIDEAVRHAGYALAAEEARPKPGQAAPSFFVRNRRVVMTALSGLFVLLGAALGLPPLPAYVSAGAYLVAILIGGIPIARAGFYATLARQLDINALMTIAVIGAMAIGEWSEGATVVFLFSLGNTLQAYTVDRARNAIRSLMELAPAEASVRRNGGETRVPVEQVQVGDAVVIHPGERIPVDGQVAEGHSFVNQAPVTGESIPVEKSVEDGVFAGTVNGAGLLVVRATKPYAENTISRIITMVEEAQAKRAPSQQFVDRFARYYTPAVVLTAFAIAVLPPLLLGQTFQPWLYRALAMLIVACPCALVISTPVSIVSAIANASRNGILVKGGAYLEEAGGLTVVAFDKTGTLTEGRPRVAQVVTLNGYDERRVLEIAAAVEAGSEHPLAGAILHQGRHADIKLAEASQFEAIIGKGARASIDGEVFYVGKPDLFADMGLMTPEHEARLRAVQEAGQSVALVGSERELIGIIGIADQVRETAGGVVDALHSLGVTRVVMLTGDNETTAKAVARQLGLDEYRANLLPEDKVAAVKDLLACCGKVAVLGDGVNDAPALATATVGIAMGAAGTDTALETADVALMADDLSKLPYFMSLSRRTLSTVRQNIIFSLVAKGLFLLLVLPGWLTLWLAVIGDMGVSLLVTLNSMRLLRK